MAIQMLDWSEYKGFRRNSRFLPTSTDESGVPSGDDVDEWPESGLLSMFKVACIVPIRSVMSAPP